MSTTRKKGGREVDNCAKVFVEIQRRHFSGEKGLPQLLDKLAETCGCRGDNYERANASLSVFLDACEKIRKGHP